MPQRYSPLLWSQAESGQREPAEASEHEPVPGQERRDASDVLPSRQLTLRRSRWWCFAAAALGCVVALGAWTSLKSSKRDEAVLTQLRGLEQPFRLYDQNGPGGLSMPAFAGQYDGISDERPVVVNDNEWGQAHVYAIGDWGAPLPNHITFMAVPGLDEDTQFKISRVMRERAKWANPSYILNVGDNFYLGGIVMDCNKLPEEASGQAKRDFSAGWQGIYNELANIPWLSVLGNHDYGGWQFHQGWPQQIGYSFINHNWIMPARYYQKTIHHPTFDVDYFMLDTNNFDALDFGADPDHNICSLQHNEKGASCARNGAMADVNSCKSWFWASWEAQQKWFEERLAASKAQWKIVVTHFPCGYAGSWYKGLRDTYGLDLLVTGHRHQQELWWPGTTSKYIRAFMERNQLGDLPCFVTGGGGGIKAEKFDDADYGRDLLWYGFFHLTIAKDRMDIELIDTNGATAGNRTIEPSTAAALARWASAPCQNAKDGDACFKSVQWARNTGVHEHPEWYPGLTAGSSFRDFQHFLWKTRLKECMYFRPCESPTKEEAEHESDSPEPVKARNVSRAGPTEGTEAARAEERQGDKDWEEAAPTGTAASTQEQPESELDDEVHRSAELIFEAIDAFSSRRAGPDSNEDAIVQSAEK